MSNALRRGLHLGEKQSVPRMSDLPAIIASTMGKIEMESVEDGRESRILEELTKKAVLNVFGRYFNVRDFDPLVLKFEEGLVVETGSELPSRKYTRRLKEMEGFAELLAPLDVGKAPESVAAAMEFVLEGLHLNRRLNRDRIEDRYRYRS